MKIGDLEVPDTALEAALKSLGKRVVEDNDYIKKAEAAADLSRFRAVTGENRSVDEIAEIIKKHEESEKKNKTQAELLKGEVDRLTAELKKRDAETTQMKKEIQKQAVARHFQGIAEQLKVKVIPSILEKYQAEFYELDTSKVTQDELNLKVTEALKKASEEQTRELAALGLRGNTTQEGASFGAGMFGKPPESNDIYKLLDETAASARGIPLNYPTNVKP